MYFDWNRNIDNGFVILHRTETSSLVKRCIPVPKTKLQRIWIFVGENSLTYEIHSVNIIVEKVLPIDGQPK